MNTRFLLITSLYIFLFSVSNQVKSQNCIVSGYVKDNSSGEGLPAASIYIEGEYFGVTSNVDGYYALKLPKGIHTVVCSFVGFDNWKQQIDITGDIKVDINLTPSTIEIKGVEVYGEEQKDKSDRYKISTHRLSQLQINKVASLGGEKDILKELQSLPGVNTANEGSSGISVRGGSYDQNLVLLDDAPIYNPTHMLGFFSVFNSDALKDVVIYKGDYPSRFGGRASSVVDIHMREGNNQSFAASGSVGLMASRITVEGPIIKSKASFIVSGRYSYVGQVLNQVSSMGGDLGFRSLYDLRSGNDVHFHDINLKFNYILSEKDHVFLSAYNGNDFCYLRNIDDANHFEWGNKSFTARWNHTFSNGVFSKVTIIQSGYKSYISSASSIFMTNRGSGINDFIAKWDVDYIKFWNINLRTGISTSLQKINPGDFELTDTLKTINFSFQRHKTAETALYLEGDASITNRIKITVGLRNSLYLRLGPGFNTERIGTSEIVDTLRFEKNRVMNHFTGIDPRVEISFNVNDKANLLGSISRHSQFQHLVSASVIGLPSDFWFPSTNQLQPIISDNLSFGFVNRFNKGITFKTEVYFRNINGIADFKDNVDILMKESIDNEVLQGKAKSYGLELFLSKDLGKFTGWVSYTLSSVKYKINGINSNKSYSPTYDKPHNLSIVANYQLSKSWSTNAAFKFTSGTLATIPKGSFLFDNFFFQLLWQPEYLQTT